MQPPEAASDERGEREPELRPRIWVGCLRDYNQGLLYGAWLDASQEPDDLQEATEDLLARSPGGPGAEEWAIFDDEDFAGIRIDEYDSFDTVHRLAGGLVAHGAAFGAWVQVQGSDPENTARFEDAFLGHWPSLGDYAEELLADLGIDDLIEGVIPKGLRAYVRLDVDGFARDLELGGDVSVVEAPGGGVWIFDARV